MLYRRVPFYRRKMDDLGVKPLDIRAIDDIARLPLTTKDEMREVYPYGLLAVDLKEIVEIHTSSGTTGKPVVDAYTAGDIDVWSEVMARTLATGGTARHDIVQNAFGYGLFTGGLGVHYGAHAHRRHGHPHLGRQHQAPARGAAGLQVVGAHLHPVLRALPRRGRARGRARPREDLPLKAGFFGAEPWSETMREGDRGEAPPPAPSTSTA